VHASRIGIGDAYSRWYEDAGSCWIRDLYRWGQISDVLRVMGRMEPTRLLAYWRDDILV
jgi:hypothetical protein